MKLMLATVSVLVSTSQVSWAECTLPEVRNKAFVYESLDCDQLTGLVQINQPKVNYFNNTRSLIVTSPVRVLDSREEHQSSYSSRYTESESESETRKYKVVAEPESYRYANSICRAFGLGRFVSWKTPLLYSYFSVGVHFTSSDLVDPQEFYLSSTRTPLYEIVCARKLEENERLNLR